MSKHNIRTVHEAGVERAAVIGSAICVGRHLIKIDEFAIGVMNLREGGDCFALFTRADMIELRDALNRELAS